VDVATVKLFLVREGNGVDQEVDLAPLLLEIVEDSVDAFLDRDIAIAGNEGAEFRGERFNPLAERLALIGKSEFRTLLGQRLGDTPRDRPVVRDPHDEAALSCHQAVTCRHETYSASFKNGSRIAQARSGFKLCAICAA